MKTRTNLIVALFALCFTGTVSDAYAWGWHKRKSVKNDSVVTPESKYDELVKKAKTREGMFRIHQVEKDWYFEIDDSLIDKSNKKTANLQLVSHFYGASPEKKIGIDRMVLSCCTVPAGRIRLSTHNFCTMSRSVGTGREKTGCCDGTVRCHKIFAGRLFLFWERSRRRIVCGRLRR